MYSTSFSIYSNRLICCLNPATNTHVTLGMTVNEVIAIMVRVLPLLPRLVIYALES